MTDGLKRQGRRSLQWGDGKETGGGGVGRGVMKDGTEVNILYMRTVNKT